MHKIKAQLVLFFLKSSKQIRNYCTPYEPRIGDTYYSAYPGGITKYKILPMSEIDKIIAREHYKSGNFFLNNVESKKVAELLKITNTKW